MKRDEIKRRVDQIYANYHGAERQKRIQQFIASLGKETHEQLAEQVMAEFQESMEKMYGRAGPKSMPETGSRQIEEKIAREGIPEELLADSSIEGMIEPFRSQEILRRSIERRKGKPKKTVEDLLRKFEEKLRREGL